MIKKSTRLLLCFVLFGLTSPTNATPTFTEVWDFTLNAWGVTTVSLVTGAIIWTIKKGCSCILHCCRRRCIRKKLEVFDSKKLLEGMAEITQENLTKASGENVTIFIGALAKEPAWYIISGASRTKQLADGIKRDGGINEAVRGLVIVGASFGHPHLASHSTHTDTTSADLKTITNCCIDHRIPILIFYLGQDTHAKHLPSFKLASLCIPATNPLFDGARTRSDMHIELSVEQLLTHYGPIIEAKSSQIAEHTRGSDAYPPAARAKHESKNFRKSLRNFIEEPEDVVVAVSSTTENDDD